MRIVGLGGYFRGKIYGVAVAFEALGIALAIWLMRGARLKPFLVPAIGMIVGVHFLGIWQATGMAEFLWTAVGICGVCASALFLPELGEHAVNLRLAITGFGIAVVLSVTAAAILIRAK